MDGDELVVGGQHPRVVAPGCCRCDRVGERWIARQVVGHRWVATRQFIAGVPAGAPVVGGHDVFERRVPVGVEHHDRVGLHAVQPLATQPVEAVDDREVLATVHLQPGGQRQHQRRDVRDERGPDDLTHAGSVDRARG